jgi:hypothetical protein
MHEAHSLVILRWLIMAHQALHFTAQAAHKSSGCLDGDAAVH